MPISYESPAPFNATLAGRYGAFQASAAAQQQQTAVTAQAQEGQANRQLQATLAGEQLAGSMSQANADRAAQMENASRERQARLVQDEEGNRQRQEQMKLQSQLQTTELTQTEQLRYNRMKQAVGSVNADDTLAPEEKHALITQLQTGINPLEQRLAATKVQQEELQTKQMVEHAKKLAAFDAADAQTKMAYYMQSTIPAADGSRLQFVPGKGYSTVPGTEPAKAAAAKPEKPFVRDEAKIHKDAVGWALGKMGLDKAPDDLSPRKQEFNDLVQARWEDVRKQQDALEQAHAARNPGGPAGAAPAPGATPSPGQPAAGQAPPPATRPPVDLDPEKMTPRQNSLARPISEEIVKIQQDPKLPQGEKMRRSLILQKLMKIQVESNGEITPAEKEEVRKLRAEFDRPIPSQPGPAADVPVRQNDVGLPG